MFVVYFATSVFAFPQIFVILFIALCAPAEFGIVVFVIPERNDPITGVAPNTSVIHPVPRSGRLPIV